jgi:pyruvate dehydrogenase E1 component
VNTTDTDLPEIKEWLESVYALVATLGAPRAALVLDRVVTRAREAGIALGSPLITDYINTISPDDEAPFPGDEAVDTRLRHYVRWNAAVMVARANRRVDGIGGHLATYASAATLYEVGFNHFFRGKTDESFGDQIFFQGHASPGIYARAFLEGRLSERELDGFRREVGGGLPSYPHPRRSNFWEFPTVSMGLGLVNAAYQARFNRYLAARGIADTADARVWCFAGDGEMDEPESLAGVALGGREHLDNLIFVVNCNLQRLDGPVRGNGQIIQELEAAVRGAGWNVI